ncbi:RHS repeat-associated core domain-containing protein, partial [Shewanella sp. SG41-3]|uniref:RHS repeat-associated core domain-containing protein n=1 Tax=Shewanella sp. SG41-3 TaxID=2760977 RepID=UPI0015FEF3E0
DKQQRSFNGLNQLVQINVNGKLTQYEYDALGRRSAKITELGRTDFIWDNHQLIGECTLGEYSWYIYQPDTFTPVALIKAGQIYYYHLDQLGTPICLTDGNAQIVWRSQQDVFGQSIDHVDSEHQIVNPIRFQGQYFDAESGLHYNRFRYYSPQQARFIHQDPIGLVGGINHYQYGPNPVNWVDPFGLCKENNFLNADANGNLKIAPISEELASKLLNTTGIINPSQYRQLPSSVLNNRLGSGGYKEALFIDDEQVFLIPKRDSTSFNPASIEDIKQEAKDLDKIKALGLPVLTISEFAETTNSDGELIQGGVQERMLFNGRDIEKNIIPGTNSQGITVETLHSILSQATLDELERIFDMVESKNIYIKDLQFMYGSDGLPRIADPQNVVNNASQTDVDECLDVITYEYKFISNIILNKE